MYTILLIVKTSSLQKVLQTGTRPAPISFFITKKGSGTFWKNHQKKPDPFFI